MRSTRSTAARPAPAAPAAVRGAGRTGGAGRRSPTAARPPRRGRALRRLLVVLTVLGLVGAGGWAWWQGSVGPLPLREHCTATAAGRSAELSPERAGNAGVIAAVATRRGLPGRAVTIALATAVQESKLENIRYGDRDSLGLFQQRPSQGWGTPEQVLDPVYASNAFYNALVKIEDYGSLSVTVAAQRVQRSAYPTAYADHEPEGRIMASALTGYSPAGFTCVLRGPGDVAAQRPGRDGLTARARAVATAARAETGRRAAPDRADPAGTTLRWTLAGKEPDRLAWALASWAVARAQGLDVVRVETGGRQWRRDRPDQGWAPVEGGGVPGGQVVVRVAAGG